MLQYATSLGTLYETSTRLLGRVAAQAPGSRLLHSAAQVRVLVRPDPNSYWTLSYGVLEGTSLDSFISRGTVSLSESGFPLGLLFLPFQGSMRFSPGEYVAFKAVNNGMAVPLEDLIIFPEFDLNLESQPDLHRNYGRD